MASISEPTSLATYALPPASSKASDSSAPPVWATYTTIPRKQDGWVTLTSQADGIHILSLSNSQPVASHTLGPSTRFAAPAVTTVSERDGKLLRRTYAVIDSASDIPNKEKGKTVWRWTEDVATNVSRPVPEKLVGLAPDRVQALSALSSSHLVAISPQNVITILSTDVSVLWHGTQSPNESLVRSWIFRRRDCGFVPGSEPATIIARIVTRASKQTSFMVDVYSSGEGVSSIGSVSLDVEDGLDWSLTAAGYLSCFDSSGKWHAFQIAPSESTSTGTGIQLNPSGETLLLHSLAMKRSKPTDRPISILALNTSHVFLAATSSSSPPELVCQIWDLRYSVLLSSHVADFPAGGVAVRLELVSATSSQAILLVSPGATSSKNKTSVLVVPYTVPAQSSIANVMGRSGLPDSSRWLKPPSSASILQQLTAGSTRNVERESEEKFLTDMKTAINEGNFKLARDTYFAWVGPSASNKNPETLPISRLSHELVSTVLGIAIQGNVRSDAVSKVVTHLLNGQLVRNNMISSEGGLVRVLNARGDKELVLRALSAVPDIPEDELIRLLKQSVKTQHKSANGMDIVNDTVPPLDTLLQHILVYPTSAPAMRTALRNHLTEVIDVLLVLERLEQWVGEWCLSPMDTIEANPAAPPPGSLIPPSNRSRPPFEPVLSFIQSLLDTSFLTLIQYTPAHPVLERLAEWIKPQIELMSVLETMRSSLEPFARSLEARGKPPTASHVNKFARHGAKGKGNQAQKPAAMIGVYQLEELYL